MVGGSAGEGKAQIVAGVSADLCHFLPLSKDTHKWSTPRVSGTVPGARDGHSACVLGKIMYIFGGYEQLVSLGKLAYIKRKKRERNSAWWNRRLLNGRIEGPRVTIDTA